MKDPTRKINCPHCDHQFTLDEMAFVTCETYSCLFDIAHNEDTAVIECPVCDKEFWVKGGWQPEFTTAFAEEEFE